MPIRGSNPCLADCRRTCAATHAFGPDSRRRVLTELHPALDGRFVISESRAAALEDLDAGKCAGAAMSLGELEVVQSKKKLCSLAAVGKPLREVTNAYAVSLEYAERLSPLVAKQLASDQMSHLFRDARPKSTCASRTAASSSQLGPAELAGVLIPSAALLSLGLLVGLISKLRSNVSRKPAADVVKAAPA